MIINDDKILLMLDNSQVILKKIAVNPIFLNDIIKPYGNNIYYIGYEFDETVTSSVRSRFFQMLKFNDNYLNPTEKEELIKSGLSELVKHTSDLYSFDICCIPKSRSGLNQQIVSIFTKMMNIKLIIIELVKELSKDIKFDFDTFLKEELESEVNGRERYTEKQKQEQLEKIIEMLRGIKNSDYFSIAESVGKNKYKKYFKDFLKLDKVDEIEIISKTKKPILIIDDVTTTGKTLLECLKTLRTLNSNVDIIIFTLIGKKF